MKAASEPGHAVGGRLSGGTVLAALCVLAAAVCAAAGSAHAGAAGIRVGYYDGKSAGDPVLTVGVFDRFDIPGPLNLELSADYRREQLRGGDLEATVIPVRISAVLNLLPVVSPYLLAGGGIDFVGVGFHNELSARDSQLQALPEVHAGGGIEISLGPVSVVGDVRYCRTGTMSSETVRAALGHEYDPSGWYASLSAGISF